MEGKASTPLFYRANLDGAIPNTAKLAIAITADLLYSHASFHALCLPRTTRFPFSGYIHVYTRARAHVASIAGCGKLPESWGVETVADITNLTKTPPKTALDAYGQLVAAIYNTTIA